MSIDTRYMLVGPLAFPVYIMFAAGFWLYHHTPDTRLGRFIKPFLLWPYGLTFGVVDVLFNWTVGTWLFWELPQELLFTSRLTRWKSGQVHKPFSEAKLDKQAFAYYVCGLLDRHDENHCR